MRFTSPKNHTKLSLQLAGLSLIYITKVGRLRIGNVAPAQS